MTQPKWTDKDEQGNYIYFLMLHEVRDHGNTEEEAEAILTKYFGPVPKDSDKITVK
jgi:hypothetical protein